MGDSLFPTAFNDVKLSYTYVIYLLTITADFNRFIDLTGLWEQSFYLTDSLTTWSKTVGVCTETTLFTYFKHCWTTGGVD